MLKTAGKKEKLLKLLRPASKVDAVGLGENFPLQKTLKDMRGARAEQEQKTIQALKSIIKPKTNKALKNKYPFTVGPKKVVKKLDQAGLIRNATTVPADVINNTKLKIATPPYRQQLYLSKSYK